MPKKNIITQDTLKAQGPSLIAPQSYGVGSLRQSRNKGDIKPNDEQSQIILNSGRVLFNAKNDMILGFAQKSISFSANETINLDAGKYVVMEAENIYLGMDGDEYPTERAVLGDSLVLFLLDFIDAMSNMTDAYGEAIAQTDAVLSENGQGNPALSPAIITTRTSMFEFLQRFKSALPSLLSTKVYVAQGTGLGNYEGLDPDDVEGAINLLNAEQSTDAVLATLGGRTAQTRLDIQESLREKQESGELDGLNFNLTGSNG